MSTTRLGGTPLGRVAAVARLGRRTVRSSGWRGVLIVALIALSVAIATAVAVGVRSSRPTPADDAAERFGAVADVRVTDDIGGSVPFEELPPELRDFFIAQRGAAPGTGKDLAPVREVVEATLGAARVLGLVERYTPPARVLALDLTDPLSAGLVRTEASPPRAGEVLLSREAAIRLGGTGAPAELGDVVTVAGEQVRVSGLVEHPVRLHEAIAVVPAGTFGEPTTWLVDADDPVDQRRLAEAVQTDPVSSPYAFRTTELRQTIPDRVSTPYGRVVRVLTDPAVAGAATGALLLLQVGLVSAAAFATGTRRRIREFGLLGAAGASPAQIRQLVIAEGLSLGLVAVTVGAFLGLGGALLSRPLIERLTGRVVDEVVASPRDLLLPAVVGLVAVVAAAWWPAGTISRTSVVSALAGRIPSRAVPRRFGVAALAVLAAGIVVITLSIRATSFGLFTTGTLVIGVLLTGVGAAAVGVPLLSLGGRAADRLPLRPRLVVRDAVRQQTRSGATVAALVVVLIMPTYLLTAQATDDARYPDLDGGTTTVTVEGPHIQGLRLPVTDTAAEAARELLPPAASAITIATVSPPAEEGYAEVIITPEDPTGTRTPSGQPVLATADLLDAVSLSADDRAAVEAGSLVVGVVPPAYVDEPGISLGRGRGVVTVTTADRTRSHDVRGLVVTTDVVTTPVTLVGEPLADDLGLTVRSEILELRLSRQLTAAEGDLLFATQLPDGASAFPDRVDVGDGGESSELVGLGLALLAALVIIGMTTALAATESDRDLSLMVAVGASPRLRPTFFGLQAAYHAGLAAVIAIPTGLLLHLATQRTDMLLGGGAQPTVLVVPWTGIALVALGMPLLLGLAMAALVRSGRPSIARRIA